MIIFHLKERHTTRGSDRKIISTSERVSPAAITALIRLQTTPSSLQPSSSPRTHHKTSEVTVSRARSCGGDKSNIPGGKYTRGSRAPEQIPGALSQHWTTVKAI